MKCLACGSVNETDARFCGECGTPFTGEQEAARQQAATINPTAAPAGNGDNDYLEQGKAIGKQYFSFAKEAVKSPMSASRRVTEQDKVNGLISHVLFALLLPLFSYIAAKNVSEGYFEVPFGSVVIQPFLILLVYLALYTTVVFGVARLMKSSVSFIEVMSRFGVFNVLPGAVMLLAVFFSLLSATFFSFLLFGISIGLFLISSLSVIFSVKEDASKGIDVYYGLIIANIAMSVIFLIIGDSIVGNLMQQLEDNLMYGLF